MVKYIIDIKYYVESVSLFLAYLNEDLISLEGIQYALHAYEI